MSAAELWTEYRRLVDADEFPFLRGQAWSRWFAAAIREGKDPSRLRRDAPTLAERIAAYTIEGLDGCAIWDGPMEGEQPICAEPGGRRTVRVRRWLLAEDGRPVSQWRRVLTTCENRRCVALAHIRAEDRHWLSRDSTGSMLAGLRQMAAKLGRTPWGREWDALGARPSSSWYYKRFGTWPRACELAGLAPPRRTYRRPVATHCKRGHELVGEALYVNPTNGRRACRICKKSSDAERWKKGKR